MNKRFDAALKDVISKWFNGLSADNNEYVLKVWYDDEDVVKDAKEEMEDDYDDINELYDSLFEFLDYSFRDVIILTKHPQLDVSTDKLHELVFEVIHHSLEDIEDYWAANTYSFQSDFIDMVTVEIIERESFEGALNELSNHSCQDFVAEFMYTNTCKEFYIKHIDHLEDFIDETEANGIEVRKNSDPRYVFVCHFVFESFCQELYTLLCEED